MPITAADIKLLASERMTDTNDGGGRRTSNVIPDGVAGNIFPKIDRLGAVYGRVNLRKVYGSVQTANGDTYAGAHAVIMEPPFDKNIIVNLFSTASDFDVRDDARDRIESYVISGPESHMILLGRQRTGQMSIQAYQRAEETLPEVGQVYCLSTEVNGIVSAQQYVRISDIKHEVRTFTDNIVSGAPDFTRRVLTLMLTTPLSQDFAGQDAPSRMAGTPRPTLIRSTNFADASRYYGIAAVTEAALAGALTMRVESVYAPIVPTTQRETAVSMAEIAGAAHVEPTATSELPWMQVGDQFGAVSNVTMTVRTATAITPGTLKLKIIPDNGTAGGMSGVVSDDGAGNIVPETNPLVSYQRIKSGTVDYASGVIIVTFDFINAILAHINAAYVPGVEVSQAAHTRELPIDLATRGTVFAQTLLPIPAKGTAIADYRALGRWYRLRDDGTGHLKGDDPAFGVGTIDYVSGALVVTLGALPDVGSSVLLSWGSPAHYMIKAGASADAGNSVKQTFTLKNLPANPGSVAVSYLTGGVAQVATSDVNGNFGNHGVNGTVNHATGRVDIEYTSTLPDLASNVTVTYQQEIPSTSAPTTLSGDVVVVDITNIDLATAVAPHGLSITLPLHRNVKVGGADTWLTVKCADDGNGQIATTSQTNVGNSVAYVAGGQIIGTVDYATGHVSITGSVTIKIPTFYWYGARWDYDVPGVTVETGTFPYSVRTGAAATYVDQTEAISTVNDAKLRVALSRTSNLGVQAGSVWFTLSGKQYIDRNGTLYCDVQPDASGTVAGTIDYGNAEASLEVWTGNVALGLSVQSCLVVWGTWTAVKASFRTAGSPLRTASAYVQVTADNGDVLTATANNEGALTGDYARGGVNQQMGVIEIEWGSMVAAAGNETEPWYDAANVVGGQIWKPRAVLPGTIRYNCVVLSNLPLKASILGLEPVRLPTDGRVPIFRAADVAVVHNTKAFPLPNPPLAGETYNVGRIDLSEAWLVDANGARVDATMYVADLAAGSVTMAANLDTTGAALPWTAKHRIEQVNLLTDVQINGEISFASALARDFDVDTYVSSAILFGDLFSRVASIFDQATWDGVWQDSRRGNDSAAAYNTIDYPILVQNDSAVTERWRINFTTAAAFQVIGEQLGVIATGSTAADCAPLNALTGKPYFTLRAAGWGGGWGVGNQLRFNTVGATAPIWIARTVLPGATLNGDSLDMQLRGDVDA